MAAYNAEKYVSAAIGSVLEQTFDEFELIVVDDCSNDATAEIARDIAADDPRIRVQSNAVNGGPGHARNAGIALARGEWLTFLDSDDWYGPDRLKTLMETAEATSDKVIADNQHFFDEEQQRPFRRLFRSLKAPVTSLSVHDVLRMDKISGISDIGLVKPFVHRSIVNDNNVRVSEIRTFCEDFYFLLSCVYYAGGMAIVDAPNYYYRVHDNSFIHSLEIDPFRAVMDIHQDHARQFVVHDDPVFDSLMADRERQIRNYIRYQRAILPIKQRDAPEFLKRFAADPLILARSSPFLFRALVRRAYRLKSKA